MDPSAQLPAVQANTSTHALGNRSRPPFWAAGCAPIHRRPQPHGHGAQQSHCTAPAHAALSTAQSCMASPADHPPAWRHGVRRSDANSMTTGTGRRPGRSAGRGRPCSARLTRPWCPHVHGAHASMAPTRPWCPHVRGAHASMVPTRPWRPHVRGAHTRAHTSMEPAMP